MITKYCLSDMGLTQKDLEAIARAKRSCWEDIDENWAETDEGKAAVHSIEMRKYFRDEANAGLI